MDANTPITLVVASYRDRKGATQDFKTVWGAKHEGEFDHIAAAVLTKDSTGHMRVERHDSSAKHLAWGGAVLGAALTVVAPPAGVAVLATDAGVLAGAGGIVGHFYHNIPKKDVQQMSDLLEAGESGLVVAAVNRSGEEMGPLLEHADRKIVSTTVKGDLEASFNDAVRAFQKAP